MKYDLLTVGAGLYGAVFSHEAVKAGKKVLVIDKRSHIGGNIYTENIEGINVHRYGAHIFHTDDKKIWDYVSQFAEFNNYVNSPVAVYGDELYNLPFNMNTFSKMWGIKTPAQAKEIIDRQRRESGISEPKNLEEQAIFLAGRDIFEKLIKGYTEKQWGRKCSELPPFIIKRVPLRFTYDNNYFTDRYQGIPIGGYTKLAEKMLDGCDIMLDTDYFDVRDSISADTVVYTGPADRYFDYRFGRLEYRSLRFETEILDTDNYQGNAVVNYTGSDVPYTRIIEHRHFEKYDPELVRSTVVTREYPIAPSEGCEPYYPVNDSKNNDLYEKYRLLADKERTEKNVIFGGRLGLYRYMDMDDVIAKALDDFSEYMKGR
ncbi:MAG: UDP-galactopyranose mutase [Huintestinicola sp.]